MAKISTTQTLLPSVLDRLIDHEPETTQEPAKVRQQLLRNLKQSVRRDLESLLNTRRRARGWPDDCKELRQSLVGYGIPDFTGANMGSAESREDFRSSLEDVLRTFEPRFKTVKVVLLDNVEPLDRSLRFRIDAMLYAEPAPEPVVFDSHMDPGSGNFKVQGG